MKPSPSLRHGLQGSLYPANRVIDIVFVPSPQVYKCVQRGFWPLSIRRGMEERLGEQESACFTEAVVRWLIDSGPSRWGSRPFSLWALPGAVGESSPIVGKLAWEHSCFPSIISCSGTKDVPCHPLLTPAIQVPQSLLRGLVGAQIIGLQYLYGDMLVSYTLFCGPGDKIQLVISFLLWFQDWRFSASPVWVICVPLLHPPFLQSKSDPYLLGTKTFINIHPKFSLIVSFVASLSLCFWIGRKCSWECQWGHSEWGSWAEIIQNNSSGLTPDRDLV